MSLRFLLSVQCSVLFKRVDDTPAWSGFLLRPADCDRLQSCGENDQR